MLANLSLVPFRQSIDAAFVRGFPSPPEVPAR